MKTTLSVLAAVCVVIAGYFGIRHFTHKDLGFTPARSMSALWRTHCFTPKLSPPLKLVPILNP